jgi:hypothetical protein
MKKLLFFALLATTGAKAQHSMPMAEDKPSTHGMLIFGTSAVYASHLPLFHAPHNYQVILELEMSAADKSRFLKDQQQHPETATYTMEPEKFILPEMIANPRPFTINIYRGHFERGGVKIAENIRVLIKQVIYFKKFIHGEPRATSTQFILFGNSKEQFAAHYITNKPDFEQIIQVKTAGMQLPGTAKYKMITTDTTVNTPIGVSGNIIEVQDGDRKIKIGLQKQLYLEFDDLKE